MFKSIGEFLDIILKLILQSFIIIGNAILWIVGIIAVFCVCVILSPLAILALIINWITEKFD